MIRTALIDKLELVTPALSDNDLVPVMTHLWFRGTRVMAYNDKIAISTALKTEFKGAVPGDVLLSLLKNSKAKEVEFDPQATELLVKAASSRINLTMLSPDNFVFDMPKTDKEGDVLPVKVEEFLSAIEDCLRSVTLDTSVPDQLGVTLIPGEKSIGLYSTNNATLTHVSVKTTGKLPFKNRVVLSTDFCKQMLVLARMDKKGGGLRLSVTDDSSILVTTDGTVLFGRLIEVEKPMDFEGVLKAHLPAKVRDQLIPIPEKMRLMLERAVIITDSNTDKVRTEISVKAGKMKFFSKSSRGEVTDTVQVEDHPDATIMLEPKLIRNGWGFFDHFLITDKCAIMAKGNNKIYLISGK